MPMYSSMNNKKIGRKQKIFQEHKKLTQLLFSNFRFISKNEMKETMKKMEINNNLSH